MIPLVGSRRADSMVGTVVVASEPVLPRHAARGKPVPREARLVRRAQAGEADAMEALFRAHWPRAYRTALLIVHDHAAAEDIAQEGFLAAVRALDGFDRRRRFGPWLTRIVANRAIDFARARSARREFGEPPERGSEDRAEGFSDAVLDAIATLTPERRALVVLRYALGYTPGEIAAVLGLPRGTVNSRLRRALDALDAELSKDDDAQA